MDNFGKIRRHHWKERLKISKIAMFEIDLLKTNEDTALQSREILQTFVKSNGPIKWAPASVNFRNFAELYIATIPSLAKDASLSNLAILLILRRSFQWCRRIFPNWSIKKVEKTVKRSIVSKKKIKYRVFSYDVTAAILVFRDNESAAMLVSQTNPLGVELFSYANAFFCSSKFA